MKKFSSLKKHILDPILDRYNIPEKEKKYLVSFYVQGISAIIEEWVKADCQETIDDINRIIIKCVKKIK